MRTEPNRLYCTRSMKILVFRFQFGFGPASNVVLSSVILKEGALSQVRHHAVMHTKMEAKLFHSVWDSVGSYDLVLWPNVEVR